MHDQSCKLFLRFVSSLLQDLHLDIKRSLQSPIDYPLKVPQMEQIILRTQMCFFLYQRCACLLKAELQKRANSANQLVLFFLAGAYFWEKHAKTGEK